jgi:hypothetical protein
LGELLLGEVVRHAQLATVNRAELLRQLQQLLGDPSGHIDEDQVGKHRVGAAQPPGNDAQQLQRDLRTLLGPLLQGFLG